MREMFGRVVSPEEIYYTRDAEVIKNMNALRTANGVASMEALNSIIMTFPLESLIKVIQLRYRNSMYKLQDKGIADKEYLGTNLFLDLNIIRVALDQNRQLFDEVFDAAMIMGESDPVNIIGLLETLNKNIQNAHVVIPLIDGHTNETMFDAKTNQPVLANEYCSDMIEYAKEKGKELGYDTDTKAL